MSMGTQPFIDAITLFVNNAAKINPRYRKLGVSINPINNNQQIKIQIKEVVGTKTTVFFDVDCTNRHESGIYEIVQVAPAGFLSALRYAEAVNPRMLMHKVNDAVEQAKG